MQEKRVGGSQRGMMTTKSECVYILAFYLLWKRRYIDLCTMCDCVGPYTVAAVGMKTRLTALKKLNAKKNKRKREKRNTKSICSTASAARNGRACERENGRMRDGATSETGKLNPLRVCECAQRTGALSSQHGSERTEPVYT